MLETGRKPRHLPGHRPLRHERGSGDVQSGLELLDQYEQRDATTSYRTGYHQVQLNLSYVF